MPEENRGASATEKPRERLLYPEAPDQKRHTPGVSGLGLGSVPRLDLWFRSPSLE